MAYALVTPLPCRSASPEELLQVGTGAFSDGFYHVAEAQFREFISLYPGHSLTPKVLYLLGKALYQQKKFEEAYKTFEQLTIRTDTEARDGVHYWLARSCQELNNVACAKEHYGIVVETFPKSVWTLYAHHFLGKIAFQEDRLRDAETHFRKTIRDPRITASLVQDTSFWLGLTLYHREKYSEAVIYLGNVLHMNPPEPMRENSMYWLAETQLKLGRYEESRASFRMLLEQFPRSALAPHALLGEALSLREQEQWTKVVEKVLALIKTHVHSSVLPQAIFMLGEAYLTLENYQEAVDTFKKFLARFPDDPRRGQCLLNLGLAHLRLGDFARVKQVAYDIVKLPPGEQEKALAQYILGELNFFEEKCQEAIPYWFNLLNVQAYRQDALFKIAMCSFREGKFKESLVNLDLLQLEYPNFPSMDEALWLEGEAYRELNSITEAVAAYENLVSTHSYSSWAPWGLYRLASIHLSQGNKAEAERWFRELNQRFPFHKVTYEAALRLGVMNAERVEYHTALSYLNIATRSSDKKISDTALSWLGEIYFNLKQYAAALDCYEKIVSRGAIKGDAMAALAYLEIGNIRQIIGDVGGSETAYKHAIEISTDKEFVERVQVLLKELKKTGAKNT